MKVDDANFAAMKMMMYWIIGHLAMIQSALDTGDHGLAKEAADQFRSEVDSVMHKITKAKQELNNASTD